MTGAAKIPTGATPLDVMIGALENEIAALRKQNDALVQALEAVEWAVPTPDADTDGSCPSCYAGKPAKLWFLPVYRTVEFERENHMKVCQLADALEQVK